MAETAKLLSPEKTVLLPSLEAGCSLAASIDADQLREWKAEHPGAVVVAYVNTSAAVKAESDICCTSSNAVDVVASIPEDREILFLPDQFLGAHVERQTGRKMHIWMGECHVHAGIQPGDLQAKIAAEPDVELMVHPECGCTTNVIWLLGEGDAPRRPHQGPVDRRHGHRGGDVRPPPVPRGDRDGHPAPAAAREPRQGVRARRRARPSAST